jgi:hypothetical protein
MRREERYKRVIEYFEKAMPVAESELNYENPYQLLVAVVLSAQCTDERVNIVSVELFKRYPTAADMAEAEPDCLTFCFPRSLFVCPFQTYNQPPRHYHIEYDERYHPPIIWFRNVRSKPVFCQHLSEAGHCNWGMSYL